MYARNRQIKKLFIVLLVVLPLLYGCVPSESDPDAVKADPNTTDQHIAIAAMNESAENVFQYTRRDEPEKARTEMNALARQVEQLNFAGLTSVEGMNALTSAIVEGKQIYSAARFDRNRALLAAGRIRLAVDALDQSRRPMWLQYDSVFQQDVADMRSAMEATDADRLKQLYQRTRSHYEMIRPALLISLDLSKSGALDSLLNAMDRRIATGPLQELRPLIEHYATVLNDTFQTAPTSGSANEDDPLPVAWIGGEARPLFWTLSIGAVIVSVLGYVGWGKYRYERDHAVPVRKRDHDPGR